MSFASSKYNCSGSAGIVVEDLDLIGTTVIAVNVVSTTETTPEQVILNEVESGRFENQIPLNTNPPSADGALQIQDGDTITVTYHDMHYGDQGEMDVTDSSLIDCQGPQIHDVTTSDITFESATVSWSTNEEATSRVEYGLDETLGAFVEDVELAETHTLSLASLDACAVYYYRVLSTDMAGNETIDDNGGLLYSFTTYQLQLFMEEMLDSSPGWTVEDQWAFGQPAGAGGDPTSGHTGTNVYGYNLNGLYPDNMTERHLTTTVMDCSAASGTVLSFWRWLGVESASYDHAYVRISTNGTTWTNIWNHTGSSFQDTAWQFCEFDISAYADGQSTVYLRWTMGATDGSVTYSGWNIDDIMVYASFPCGETPTPGPTRTPTTAPTITPTRTPTMPPTITPTRTPTMSPTFTPTYTPIPPTYTPIVPTDTPIPTNTPEPTSTETPVNSETPAPTETQAPTETPEPSTPTETPTSIPEKGMILVMEDKDLVSGDTFYLHMLLNNPDSTAYDADAYVLLGIGTSYWSWPSWSDITQNLDKMTYTCEPLTSMPIDILNFDWPQNVGALDNLMFIGCLFEPESWEMIGQVQLIDWSCH